MIFAKLGAAIFAGAVLFATAPAQAASPVSAAFLANVDANVAFLDHSSRLAATRAGSGPIRTFARSAAVEQAQLVQALDLLVPASRTGGVASASAEDPVLSGRSVAIDGDPTVAAKPAANGRASVGESALARLTSVSGRAFDDLYWQTQLDALSQLEADYRAYIAPGDDPVLVGLAQRELPKVIQRLTELSRI